MREFNTLLPYKSVDYQGIQYSVCRDFDHISRYKGLRQLVHNPLNMSDRFISLETSNPIRSDVDVIYHEVLHSEENRLDLIAAKTLGSASYGWIVAYFNNIEDGFSVLAGQVLQIPKSISSLFSKNELLAPIPALQLNLGTE